MNEIVRILVFGFIYFRRGSTHLELISLFITYVLQVLLMTQLDLFLLTYSYKGLLSYLILILYMYDLDNHFLSVVICF